MDELFRMSDAELLVWLSNFIAIGTANQTTLKFTPAEIAELTALYNDLGVKVNAKLAAVEASRAATETAKTVRDNNLDKISYYNKTFKLDKDVTKALIEQLGLKPDAARTSPPPTEPLELNAAGFDNGINRLKWKRNGNKPNTQFVIEAMIGNATEFSQIGVTTKTEFEHLNQKPGVQVIYRVKAVRTGRESIYSNEFVLYRKAV